MTKYWNWTILHEQTGMESDCQPHLEFKMDDDHDQRFSVFLVTSRQHTFFVVKSDFV